MLSTWKNRLAVVSVAAVVTACGGGSQQEGSAPAPGQQPPAAAPAAPAPAADAAPAEGAPDYTGGAVTDGGKVTGKVTLVGAPPEAEEVEITKDNTACGDKKKLQTVKVGAAGELAEAIVWIDDIKAGKAWPGDGTGAIDQKNCEYLPSVQAVPVNANVTILNSDPVLHNIHAYDAQGETLFNMAQPTQGQKNDKKLGKSGPVEFKCDVHSWMKATVFVAGNPYFAVTGPDGSYTLDEVPPGSYKVKVWHSSLGAKEMDVTVAAGAPATADFALEMK